MIQSGRKSPKTRFQEGKERAARHLDYAASAAFAEVSDFAMLQLVEEMSDTTEQITAVAYYHRLMGAKQYHKILANLAEKQSIETQRPDRTNLNHEV